MKFIFFAALISPFVFGSDIQTYELTIKDHKFSTEVLKVKANEKFKLKINNQDASSEEFESRTMVIEKFIGPNKTVTVILGPLKPGSYDFIGEFHQNTAKGQVVAE